MVHIAHDWRRKSVSIFWIRSKRVVKDFLVSIVSWCDLIVRGLVKVHLITKILKVVKILKILCDDELVRKMVLLMCVIATISWN